MTTESPENYQSLSHLEQILLRPNMYIGNTENTIQEEYVLQEDNSIIKNKIIFNEGLARIFIEPLCNAIDNVWRSGNIQTYIKVSICSNRISIINDGIGIPIEEKDNRKYVPEIIFGTLLSSSNYDDSKERKTSGLHGLGCKLSNIFSTNFEIKIIDADRHLSYDQTWSNNMRNKNSPIIKKDNKSKKNYIEVSFQPDLEYFKISPDDFKLLFSYMNKKIVDTAFICSPSVKVYLNNNMVPIKTIEDYAKYYIVIKDKIQIKSSNYDILIASNPDDADNCVISFVNGIETSDGGVHIDAITSSLYNFYSNKFKSQKFTWKDIKRFFHIFAKFEINQPKFNSQLKNKLTSPKITIEIPSQKLTRLEINDVIRQYLEQKNEKKLIDTLQKTRKQKIEGYDAANRAGTKESSKCILIITEGLSAKTFATVGIKYGCLGVSGRDFFGIYPIRGKLLNVRNATHEQIEKNREINDIVRILNEKNNKTSYGKILLLTDADVDGNHIEGLFINFIELLFPSMINNIYTMRTPILKIPKGKSFEYYFDELEANDYIIKNNIRNVKYYKGLGTSNNDEIKDIFGINVVKYSYDNDIDKDHLQLAFSSKKNFSDKRKEWLAKYQKDYIDKEQVVTITSFINKEFIRFSNDDCLRSIPSLIDGLKISQRKVLYGVFRKDLNYEGKSMKVAQLGGYIAEITNYHHGENNLHETIIKMAHEFVGSNNIALLYPDGQFGSRLSGGKDAASARYIFTKQNILTSLIFNKGDNSQLKQEIYDGDLVEYSYYIPIIPMILVNGSIGIGTGWSTSIPPHDPRKIIDKILSKLKNDTNDDIIITPYYNNFKGEIKSIDKHRYEIKGVIKKNGMTYEISELPIGESIDSFKEYLDNLMINKKIAHYSNQSTTINPSFIVKLASNNDVLAEIEKKLTSYVTTTNMVCLDTHKNIRKYENVEEIINEYYEIRLDYYEKRRLHIIDELIKKLCVFNNKYLFIKNIIEDKIVIYKKKLNDIILILKNNSFDPHPVEGNYNYLIDLQFRHTSEEKLAELKKQIKNCEKDLEYYKKITDKKMWELELINLKNKL